jgi:hypothetical protein
VLLGGAVSELAGGGEVDGVREADARHPARLFHQVRRLVRRLRVDVVDHHGRAIRREPQRGGPADAPPGAGDDRDLAVQPAHARTLPVGTARRRHR